ncbi:MAG: lysostaphin resistance A-like protein [Microcystaceae cyanobacterium]
MKMIFGLETFSWRGFLENSPAFVQIGLFLLAWLVLWLPIAVPLGYGLRWHPLKGATPQQKLPLVASLYLVFAIAFSYAQWGLGISFAPYGLVWDRELLIALGIGLGLGVGGLGLTFGIETAFRWIQWRTENFKQLLILLLPLLLLGLWVGETEELIFRGLFQQQLQNDYIPLLAAVISSTIFALLHLLWERQQTWPQLPGLWLMGMVLWFSCILNNNSIGLAWGLHGAWVWGLACLDAAELLSYSDTAPEWIVGIGKNPLAGVSGLICLLGTGLVLWQGFSFLGA